MRSRRDISLTLALCLSLTAHAWIVYTIAERYVRQYATMSLAALPVPEKAAPVEPAPQPVPPPPVIDRLSQLGDTDGVGDALASSAGETPQQAQMASQVQAALSLDPEGTGGKTDQATPTPPSPPPAPPAFAAAQDEEPERSFSVPGSQLDEIVVKETPQTKPRESQRDKPQPPRPKQPPQQPAQTAQSSAPGDPAPMAESESDPFGVTPSAEFSRGQTTARLGRKHKIVRPRLEMAGQADLMQLRAPVTIVLRIHLAADGNVEKVDIVKSSGSINVDQPTQQAAYRWWFEPAKDSAGRPKTDVFEFICRFT